MKNPELCTAFLFKAHNDLIKLFGSQHALIQKYYSYISEVYSHIDDYPNMIEMAKKYIEIAERTNESALSIESIFILDPLL